LQLAKTYETQARRGRSLAQIWRAHSRANDLWNTVVEEMKAMKDWETQVLHAAAMKGTFDIDIDIDIDIGYGYGYEHEHEH
jgi:hypothetical protein